MSDVEARLRRLEADVRELERVVRNQADQIQYLQMLLDLARGNVGTTS